MARGGCLKHNKTLLKQNVAVLSTSLAEGERLLT